MKNLLLVTLQILTINLVYSSTKTATITAHCYSFQLGPTRFAGSEDWFLHFTTYGASNSYQNIVSPNNLSQAIDAIAGTANYEIKPVEIGSQTYRTDYLSQDDGGMDEHGTLTLTIPNIDDDSNGVPDFLQQENSVNITATGTIVGKWSNEGSQ